MAVTGSRGLGLDGDLVQPRERTFERGIETGFHVCTGVALHQRAAHRGQTLDRFPRRRIQRHVQRDREFRPGRKRTRGIVQ